MTDILVCQHAVSLGNEKPKGLREVEKALWRTIFSRAAGTPMDGALGPFMEKIRQVEQMGKMEKSALQPFWFGESELPAFERGVWVDSLTTITEIQKDAPPSRPITPPRDSSARSPAPTSPVPPSQSVPGPSGFQSRDNISLPARAISPTATSDSIPIPGPSTSGFQGGDSDNDHAYDAQQATSDEDGDESEAGCESGDSGQKQVRPPATLKRAHDTKGKGKEREGDVPKKRKRNQPIATVSSSSESESEDVPLGVRMPDLPLVPVTVVKNVKDNAPKYLSRLQPEKPSAKQLRVKLFRIDQREEPLDYIFKVSENTV
jgi:hypothetical protein